MDHKTRVHVISNTHWDREHRHGFQETRFMLVETLDRLIEIMEADPGFRHFTLDGQVLPLEDYLEARPAMRERLARLVREGRLLIGPWYSLPDHFSCHPEAIIRNLLIGDRVCREFGEPMPFGYSIFAWGQPAQLPQIYAGFGIDSLIFYKMYPLDTLSRAEFIWQAPDGSWALASRLGPLARSNFFFHFTIPVLLGGDANSPGWEASFTQGSKVCHLIDHAFEHPHGRELELDIRLREEQLAAHLDGLIESGAGDSHCPDVIAAFDGADFTMPLAELPSLLRMTNERFGDRVELVHSTMPDYFREFRERVAIDALPRVEGEMRFGPLMRIHCEVLGTAIRIPQAMHRVECQLIGCAEPLAAFNALLGGRYPRDLLRLAWKTLFQVQAHDTTHAVGVPKIQPDALNRLAQVQEIADGVLRRAIEGLVARIDTSTEDNDAILVTVFNPTSRPRSEVMHVSLDLPQAEHVGEYHLEDGARGRLRHYEHGRQALNIASVNNENRPKAMCIERVDLDLLVPEIPPLGYATFRLRRTIQPAGSSFFPFPNPIDPYRPIGREPNMLENEFLRVDVRPNGTFDITDKEHHRTVRECGLLIDSGEAGDMWIHRTPRRNEIITSHGAQADIRLTRNSGLLGTLRIELTMDLPISLNGDRTARSAERLPILFVTELVLRRASRRLDVTTRFENRVRDHMLTVRVPTGIDTEQLVTDVAFEQRRRPVEFVTDRNGIRGDELRRQPMHRYVDVSDGTFGVALMTRGLKEFESKRHNGTTLDLTLLRAVTQTFPVHDNVFLRFDEETAQSPGAHRFEYALYLHQGDHLAGNVQREAECYHTPLLAAQYGKGRLAGTLPPATSLLALHDARTNLSAVKLAEDDGRLIVRLNNPTGEPIRERLRFWKTPLAAARVDLNERSEQPCTIAADGTVELELPPYAIRSVAVSFGR